MHIHSNWWEWIVQNSIRKRSFQGFLEKHGKTRQSRTEPHLKIKDLSRTITDRGILQVLRDQVIQLGMLGISMMAGVFLMAVPPIAGWLMEILFKWMIWGYPHIKKPPFVLHPNTDLGNSGIQLGTYLDLLSMLPGYVPNSSFSRLSCTCHPDRVPSASCRMIESTVGVTLQN